MKYSAWLLRVLVVFWASRRIDGALATELPTCHCADTDIKITNQKTGSCSCWDCPTCQEGLGLSVPCNSTVPLGTDITCLACKPGKTFSVRSGTEQCRRCSVCQVHEVVRKKCKPWRDTVCGDCEKGYYRDDVTGTCLPCSECCHGYRNAEVKKCKKDRQPARMQCAFGVANKCPQMPSPPVNVKNATGKETSTAAPEQQQTTTPVAAASSQHPKSGEPSEKRGIMELDDAGKRAGLIVTLIFVVLLVLAGFHYVKEKFCGRRTPVEGYVVVHTHQEMTVGGQPLAPSHRSSTGRPEEFAMVQNQGNSGNTQGSNDAEPAPPADPPQQVHVSSCMYVEVDHPTWPLPSRPCPVKKMSAGQLAQRGKKVLDMHLDSFKKICDKLDVRRLDFKDCRMLAEKIGLDKDATAKITNNPSIPNPTEVILLQENPTIGWLGQVMYEMGRADVAEVIDGWVETELREYGKSDCFRTAMLCNSHHR